MGSVILTSLALIPPPRRAKSTAKMIRVAAALGVLVIVATVSGLPDKRPNSGFIAVQPPYGAPPPSSYGPPPAAPSPSYGAPQQPQLCYCYRGTPNYHLGLYHRDRGWTKNSNSHLHY